MDANKELAKQNSLSALLQVAQLLNVQHRLYTRTYSTDTDTDGVHIVVGSVKDKLDELAATKKELVDVRKEVWELRVRLAKEEKKP